MASSYAYELRCGFHQDCGVGPGGFWVESDFLPDSDVQLDDVFHHTPKLGQFLLKLLLKQISCFSPRIPMILTAKLHSLYVKESKSDILERSEL